MKPPLAPLRQFLAIALTGCFAGCASTNTLVVLLPEAGGGPSAVIVHHEGPSMELDTPFSAATVDTKNNVAKTRMTQDEVDSMFAAALAAQPPKAVSFTLYFLTNSTEVAANSRADLDLLLNEVAGRQAVEVQVTGHTDRVGSDEDNDRLSLQRAEAVRAMLIQRGIKATFIRAVGRGEREPLVPTEDGQEEALNRRVEVIVR